MCGCTKRKGIGNMARINSKTIKTVAVKAAGLIAGARAAKVATGFIPVDNTYIKNGVPLLLGAFLMTQKTPFVQALGEGMIARAGDQMLDSLGIGSPLLGDPMTYAPYDPGTDSPLMGDDQSEYGGGYSANGY